MQRRLIITLILSLSIKLSFATGQASELIVYNGDTLEMFSLPLDPYLGEYFQPNFIYFLEIESDLSVNNLYIKTAALLVCIGKVLRSPASLTVWP